MFYYLVPLIILALTALYWKIRHPMYYWRRKGVKQNDPTPILGHNLGIFRNRETFAEFVANLYNLFPNERYIGIYQFSKPVLLLRDPELIRQVTVKDFDHFTDHMKFMETVDPLWSRTLVSLTGEMWKKMRSTLSPAFTSSKMKSMFALILKCSHDFVDHFDKEKSDFITLEMKDTFTRYANDIIATCAFGIECNSLKNRENDFYIMGKQATDFSGLSKYLQFIFLSLFPRLARQFGISFFSKKIYNFFTKIISDTVKYREENSIVRPDMVHLLMEARKGRLQYDEKQAASQETGFATVEESDIANTKVPKQEITILDITANAMLFFFAGFETVSILMSFMVYELALNRDIQQILLEEIDEANKTCKGKLSYEVLNKMKYLDMIIAETLRKYPPQVIGDRICTKDYTILPTKNSEVPIELKKGDAIWIPIYAIHNDPKYYVNPEKFDPERFSDSNKGNIKPCSYIPFGSGPRNCIGSRFALLEVKTIFFYLLTKFEIVPVEKTQIPMKFDKNCFNMHLNGGFWLGMKRRNLK